MAPFGALGGAGGEIDLELGAGEDHRAHVAAVRHQSRQPAEALLQGDQRGAHGGQGGDPRRVHAGLLGADRLADVFAAQEHPAAEKLHRQLLRHPGDGRFVGGVQRQPGAAGGERRDAVQGARVEVVVAQACGHLGRQRPLARGGGAVHADHRDAGSAGLHHGKQGLEVVGEGLGDAGRVLDPHRQAVGIERGQREAHRHAVVVVGVNAGSAPCCRRRDGDEVGTFLHRGAELAQLGGHGGEPVGFLDAPAGDVAQRAGAVGIQRQHRQGHRRVGDVVAVEVDRAQRPGAARHFHPVRAAPDVGAHQAHGVEETDVALDRVLAHAGDAQRAAGAGGDRAQCHEVAGGGRIRLDVDLARRAVAAAGGDREALPAVPAHRDAEALQQVQGDFDVRLGDQLADHLDDDVLLGDERQRHQQRGEELAGDVAAHLDRRIEAQLRPADPQGRIAGRAQVVDPAAELAQRVDQVADRALVHARHAAQLEVAADHGQRRRQGPHRRPRVAEEQPRVRGRGAGREAGDLDRGAAVAHAAAQRAQRIEHHPGVVRIQQVVHDGGSRAQRRQQQDPVGNALGAGQAHHAAGTAQRRNVQEFGGEHQRSVQAIAT